MYIYIYTYYNSCNPLLRSLPFILNTPGLWSQMLVKPWFWGRLILWGRDHNHSCRGVYPNLWQFEPWLSPFKVSTAPPSSGAKTRINYGTAFILTSYNSRIKSGCFLVVRWEDAWILNEENGWWCFSMICDVSLKSIGLFWPPWSLKLDDQIMDYSKYSNLML